ncbi:MULTISPECIES: hypothetical protein [Weeksella]|uniref:hypothetical protein n=1 Tax=Weeksella TaxID=1013 RepID=UPI0008A3F579|nr:MULTISPECIES: hypothetical protein [Weeksella]MDK7375995.1 hypothetical protein [Weeksella virosa]OFM84589.1 hypothetical protein HMPREF2660_08745 [Weeksella sp. HMSC059D05]
METNELENKEIKGCSISLIGVILAFIYFIILMASDSLPFYPFLIFAGIALIGAAISSSAKSKIDKKKLIEKGIDPSKFMYAGKYLYGFIGQNEPIDRLDVFVGEDRLYFYKTRHGQIKKEEFVEIPLSDIHKVSLENKTTIQSRVGVKRLLLVGILAFAWKKKEKMNLMYLVLEINNPNIGSEVILEFEGNTVDGAYKLYDSINTKLVASKK